MRRPVIAGNWKMYKTQAETRAFFEAFCPLVGSAKHCDIIVAPPFSALAAAVDASRGSAIGIAGQNLHWEREGAFTGEISARMLVESGCRGVIIGHSERRQYFGETDESVNRKTKAALEAGLTPIVCVGETLSEIANSALSPTSGARAAGMVGIHLSNAPPSALADFTISPSDLTAVLDVVHSTCPVFVDGFESADTLEWTLCSGCF